MTLDAVRDGGCIDAVFYCPHQPSDHCGCRKPKPGLLFQAQRAFDIDLSRTLLVGDDPVDAQAAEAAGCPWTLVSEERSLLDVVRGLTSRA
jgi:D-glycero-D-manno-heptose 1,7-bisphosphate phosphatase